MPDQFGRPLPPIPLGMTRNEFGKRVMQWGTGYEAAISRMATITKPWLRTHGVTVVMAERWHRFHIDQFAIDPANGSAQGRIELMAHCLRLLAEEGDET